MYKLFSSALFAFVLFTALLSFKAYSSNLPPQLLNIPFPLISGKSISLSEFEGKKPVYIKFWATWCQPCLKEMAHFEHTYKSFGKYIEVIGVNLGVNDDLEAVKKTMKAHGLTMPMAIDKSGDLAQAFRFIGTPYHLLFDRNMNLLHRGHKANKSLDNKIALLSQKKAVNLLDSNAFLEDEEALNIDVNDGKLHALFFTATWCDWYLKESRPEHAENCISAQKFVNKAFDKYPNISWHGVASRLWTGEKDLLDYKKKYSIQHPIELDKSNQLFHKYTVKDYPTFLLIKEDIVIARITNFSDSSINVFKNLLGGQ